MHLLHIHKLKYMQMQFYIEVRNSLEQCNSKHVPTQVFLKVLPNVLLSELAFVWIWKQKEDRLQIPLCRCLSFDC